MLAAPTHEPGVAGADVADGVGVGVAVGVGVDVGVGVGAPFGLKTEYDNPWLGAAQSTMFDIKTYNVNPSIAWRVNDQVSLGFGVNWQRVEATYDRQVATTNSVYAASPLKLTLDDDSWGWNIGALWQVSDSTRIGAAYRSKMDYKLEGSASFTGLNATGNVVAGTPKVFPPLMQIVQGHCGDKLPA